MLADKLRQIGPGLATSCALAAAGLGLQWAITKLTGFTVLEALVLALLLGLIWRNTMGCSDRVLVGCKFASKEVLEVAIVLLGASVDLRTLAKVGVPMLLTVGVAVTLVIVLSKLIGRALGLSANTALLVGVGNGICGNSAIAAVAPLVEAKPEEVAASIGFTAVLSILVVLALPYITHVVPLSNAQYGVVAGMVVYAVPQVLAATFAVSPQSVAVGTLVKLTRVLFLSPVVMFFSVTRGTGEKRLSWKKLVPWFMIGFAFLAVLRTAHFIAEDQGNMLRDGGKMLTVVSMGAIGLTVDLKALGKASTAVVITVLASLLILLAISLVAAMYLPVESFG